MKRIATLGAILLMAAALRLHGLNDLLPLGNEYFYFYLSLHPKDFHQFLDGIRGNPLHLLTTQIIPYWMGLWKDSPGWLRLPSALFGCSAVWGVWRLAELNGDTRRAVASALLLSLSLLHIEWSCRTELYALISALTLFTTFSFLRLQRKPGFPAAYGLWALLLIYSSPYAAPLAALHAASIAFVPASLRRPVLISLTLAWLAAVACFVPWLAFASSSFAAMLSSDFIGNHSGLQTVWQFLGRIPLFFAQGGEVTNRLWHWGPGVPGFLALLYFLCYLASLIRALGGKGDQVLRISHLAVPSMIAAVTAIDLATRNYFSHRQLVWVLPFYLIAVADGFLWGFDLLADRVRLSQAAASAALSAAALCLLLASLGLYFESVNDQIALGEGQRRIVSGVEGHIRPGDILVFQDASLAQEFIYHYDRTAFRNTPGFRLFPERMKVRRNGKENTLEIADSSEVRTPSKEIDAERSWYFQGRMSDLRVSIPQRFARMQP